MCPTPPPDEPLLPPHGNHRELLSWQKELLADCRDCLRVRDFPLWDKDSKEALYVRRLGHRPNQTCETCREFFDTRPPETVANIAICLIHQTNYLPDQQLRRLAADFPATGGIRERMTRARLRHRSQNPGCLAHRPHSRASVPSVLPKTSP